MEIKWVPKPYFLDNEGNAISVINESFKEGEGFKKFLGKKWRENVNIKGFYIHSIFPDYYAGDDGNLKYRFIIRYKEF